MSPRPVLRPTSRPATALRSLRRAVRLHRRLLAAGLAAGAVTVGLGVAAPPPPPTTPVVVAARDLPGGGVLTGDDLAVRAFSAATVPDGAAPRDRLLGRVLAAPLRAGEPVTDVRVVGPGLVRGHGPGTVAAPVRIADAAAVALLRVGDPVDVLAPDPTGRLAPAVAVTAAPVVAIPQPADDVGAASEPGALVVLAVTAAEAQALARHAVLGPLVVTLRE